MTSVIYKPFINHIIKSDTFRKKYSSDTILEFYKVFNSINSFTKLLKFISEYPNKFSNEFYEDIKYEIEIYIHDTKCEQIATKAADDFRSSYFNGEIPQYFNDLFNKYCNAINNKENVTQWNRIRKLWDCMNEKELAIWIPPARKNNPYTRFIQLYKNKVLEVYPNTTFSELARIMGQLWNMIKPNIRYAELLDVNDRAPYVEFSLQQKQEANLVNRTMVGVLLNKDRRALLTVKKFVRMRKFLKLCKNESFNKYFWNPKNMGGRWHIHKMTNMLSEF
jgi:hypothetical protein